MSNLAERLADLTINSEWIKDAEKLQNRTKGKGTEIDNLREYRKNTKEIDEIEFRIINENMQKEDIPEAERKLREIIMDEEISLGTKNKAKNILKKLELLK